MDQAQDKTSLWPNCKDVLCDPCIFKLSFNEISAPPHPWELGWEEAVDGGDSLWLWMKLGNYVGGTGHQVVRKHTLFSNVKLVPHPSSQWSGVGVRGWCGWPGTYLRRLWSYGPASRHRMVRKHTSVPVPQSPRDGGDGGGQGGWHFDSDQRHLTLD